MQRLRNARLVARAVTLWFVLFVSASVASPVVLPGAFQVVCSASEGMKVVILHDDGSEQSVASGMDCPLCAPVVPAPPAFGGALASPSPLAHALRPAIAAHLAWLTRAPLPARGPPAALR